MNTHGAVYERKLLQHPQTVVFVVLTMSPFLSLSQSLDSYVVSELIRWDVVIIVAQQPL